MQFFNKREVRGAIAILLVIIMLPMMVLSAFMVDTARYSLAKSNISSAGDLTMNAALADYDTILKDVYGLFAMSQNGDLEEEIEQYFIDTVVSYGIVSEEDAGDYVERLLGTVYEYMFVEDKDVVDFLEMNVDASDITVTALEDSSLVNSSVLEKQIVEYMKYRGPVDFGMSFLDSLSAFTKVEEQTTIIEQQVKAQEQMGNVATANDVLYKSVVAYDTKYNELQPEPLPADNFYLKNYGNIMLSYRPRYQEINRMALIFCSGSFLGKWTEDSAKLMKLNVSGDYVVKDGAWSIPTKLYTYTSYSNLSSAKAGVESLYTKVNDSSFAGVINSYSSSKFMSGNQAKDDNTDFVSADAREKAISDFQAADLFYKSNYASFIANCKVIEQYADAVEQYDTKAQAQIDTYQGEINKLDNDVKTAEKTITDATAEKNSSLTILSDLSSEDSTLYNYIYGRVVTYRSNLEKIEAGVTDAEKAALESQNATLQSEANAEEKKTLSVDTPTWWGKILSALNIIESSEQKIVVAKATVDDAPEKRKELVDKKTALENEKTTIDNNYQKILDKYASNLNTYNSDLKMYYRYISVAKNIVDSETLDISNEFTKMYTNLTGLRDLLSACKTNMEKSKLEIESYIKKVDAWETANNTYKEGGEDNFSDTNEAGIREADTTFNKDDVQELYNNIVEEYTCLDEFIKAIDANFFYMDVKKIKDISSADEIKSVIESCSSWHSIYNYQVYESEITSEQCNAYFVYTDSIDATKLDALSRMTEPYPCCKFMNYLRQTFKASENVLTEAEKTEATSNTSSYNAIKGGGDVTKAIENDKKGNNNYGYTYTTSGVTIGGEGWPSSGAYKLTVESNKASSSDGLTANKSAASKMLSGLASAMETGRDKLLVMSYLFENFSYNTVVQDQAREGGQKLGWPARCGSDLYKDYLYTAKTSSGISFAKENSGSVAAISPLYGAEIEYILFGDSSPKTNVSYTKAAIFAVRFLFNTVYAFTNSEVRNETRAIALGVQAASLGVIPYQLVQVVLQLALAMGESAVDLKNMEVGAKVAIVKTSDTWTMSIKGAINLAKDVVVSEVETAANKALDAVQGKITEIVNAKAEELAGAVGNVQEDLQKSVTSAAEEAMNNMFLQAESILEQELSQYAFYEDGTLSDNTAYAISTVNGNVDKAFNAAKSTLEGIFGDLRSDSIEGKAWSIIKPVVFNAFDEVNQQIKNEVMAQTDTTDVRAVIYKAVYDVKTKISEKISSVTDDTLSKISATMTGKINELQNEIIDLANEKTEEAKDQIVSKLNGFINDMSDSATKSITSGSSLADVNGNAIKSSAEASVIKFGYSDYLMLFTFIGLCADDKSGAMIARVADVIQCNIANAGEGSELHHAKGAAFKMADARTYVSLEANVELNMMFLNLGIFQKQVDEYNEGLTEDEKIDLDSNLQIHYVGISGY